MEKFRIYIILYLFDSNERNPLPLCPNQASDCRRKRLHSHQTAEIPRWNLVWDGIRDDGQYDGKFRDNIVPKWWKVLGIDWTVGFQGIHTSACVQFDRESVDSIDYPMIVSNWPMDASPNSLKFCKKKTKKKWLSIIRNKSQPYKSPWHCITNGAQRFQNILFDFPIHPVRWCFAMANVRTKIVQANHQCNDFPMHSHVHTTIQTHAPQQLVHHEWHIARYCSIFAHIELRTTLFAKCITPRIPDNSYKHQIHDWKFLPK